MTYHHHRSHHRYFSAIQIYSYSGQPSSQLSNITEIRDIHRGVHRSRLREIVFPSSKIPRFSFPPGRWLINLSNLSMPNFTLTTLRGLCNNFPRLKHCDVTIALAEREYTLNIPCTCNVGSRVPPKFLEFSEICDVCEIQTSNTRSHSLRWSQEIWLGAKKILFTYLSRIISLHSLILEYIWNQIQIQLEIFPKRKKEKKKNPFFTLQNELDSQANSTIPKSPRSKVSSRLRTARTTALIPHEWSQFSRKHQSPTPSPNSSLSRRRGNRHRQRRDDQSNVKYYLIERLVGKIENACPSPSFPPFFRIGQLTRGGKDR